MSELIRALIEAGEKEEEILFAVKDATGQVVWLGIGNENAGLTHIIDRHLNDFIKSNGVTRENLADFLKEVISKGTVVSNTKSKVGTGYDRVYDYDGNYYTVAGIGSNGFIVTAFPQNKEG